MGQEGTFIQITGTLQKGKHMYAVFLKEKMVKFIIIR